MNDNKPTSGSKSDRKSGGRPRKYAEPSQPVTVTLPNSTLRQLEQIDGDRGRAIVKLARAAAQDSSTRPLVEVVEFAENAGLVVIGPNQALRKVPFLRMVEVAPARFLIALVAGHDFHQLEIALTDLLEQASDLPELERDMISQLLDRVKGFRRSESVSMAQILLVQMNLNR